MTEVIRGMMGAATIMVAAGRAVLADAVSAERCAEYFEVLQQEFPSVIDMAVAGPDKGIVCHAAQAILPPCTKKSTYLRQSLPWVCHQLLIDTEHTTILDVEASRAIR